MRIRAHLDSKELADGGVAARFDPGVGRQTKEVVQHTGRGGTVRGDGAEAHAKHFIYHRGVTGKALGVNLD